MESLQQAVSSRVKHYVHTFEDMLNSYNLTETPMNTHDLPTKVWDHYTYLLMAMISLVFTQTHLIKNTLVGKLTYHMIYTAVTSQLLLFSMDKSNINISFLQNVPRLDFDATLLKYTLIVILGYKFAYSMKRVLMGKSLSTADLYSLTTSSLWIYMSFQNPIFLYKFSIVALSYLLLYHTLVLINSLDIQWIQHITLPFIYIANLAQFIIFAYWNISFFYTPDYETATRSYFWANQFLAVVHMIAVFTSCKEILTTFGKQFRSGMTTFLLGFHAFAVIGCILIFYHPRYIRLIAEAILFYMITGLGITCGAHRLWAHRSYKAHWSFRFFLMVLNSFANQGTIYHWSRDHRVHHKYSEQEKDPHNATRGFFYSHMGWLLLKKPEAVKEAGREIDCSDLLQDPIVLFQKVCDPFWNQFLCFVLPSIYAYYIYNSFWLGFFVHGCLRWIACLHATWTVNSVAHFWGDRPYNPNINPAESFFTALFANGEGWHNWHHEYPYDYAASEGGAYTHYNPSKALIDLAAKLNLVYERKRALSVWNKVHARRLLEEKKKAEDAAENLKRNPSISKLPNLKGSLPAHVVQKSLLRSSISVVKDISLCFLLGLIAWTFQHYSVYVLPSAWYKTNSIVSIIFWTVYAILQGTTAFGLWVLGYEAAGARYCNSRILNHCAGAFLHSMLLIPYKPRRRHKEKERETASLLISLADSQFAIVKLDIPTMTSFGGVILTVFITLYALFVRHMGFSQFFHLYIGPWIVLNAWLVLYEWILENEPHYIELDLSESNWQLFTADFLLKTWPKRFMKRRRLFARFLDHLHHNLSLSHIVQAVDFDVPHYHVKEAFKRVGDLLGDVSSEVMDAKNHIVRNMKKNKHHQQ